MVLVDRAGIEVEDARNHSHLAACPRDRLADVLRLDPGQFLRVVLHQRCETTEQPRAVGDPDRAPAREGRLRARDGLVHLCDSRGLELGDGLFGRRVDHLDAHAGRSLRVPPGLLHQRAEERVVLALLGMPETPTAKRLAGSSSASIVPSSAQPTSRRSAPIAPRPWWWWDLTVERLAQQRADAAVGVERDRVVGELARRLLVPLVAHDLGQMLDEVAAADDVEDLRAAAHRQDGHVTRERGLEQRNLGGIALRAHATRGRMRLVAVQRRIEVAAAGEHEPVDRVERLLYPVRARRQQERPSPRGLDCPHVRVGHDRSKLRPVAPAGVLHVGADPDSRPAHPRSNNRSRS